MKKTSQKQVCHTYIVSLTCDCCGKEYLDELDMQEFLVIDEVGGYNSAIGDDTHYRLDMCSPCVKSILGKYLRCS